MKTILSKTRMIGFFLAGLFFGVHLAFASNAEPSSVDLKKYSGRWYEIAHQKNDYESDCAYATARYVEMSPTQLRMENSCYLEDGSRRVLNGVGTVTHPDEPGKLEVMLPFDITVDYWIVALDSRYRWAAVDARDNRSLVIFARTRKLGDALLKSILLDLSGQGYDTSQLVYDRN